MQGQQNCNESHCSWRWGLIRPCANFSKQNLTALSSSSCVNDLSIRYFGKLWITFSRRVSPERSCAGFLVVLHTATFSHVSMVSLSLLVDILLTFVAWRWIVCVVLLCVYFYDVVIWFEIRLLDCWGNEDEDAHVVTTQSTLDTSRKGPQQRKLR